MKALKMILLCMKVLQQPVSTNEISPMVQTFRAAAVNAKSMMEAMKTIRKGRARSGDGVQLTTKTMNVYPQSPVRSVNTIVRDTSVVDTVRGPVGRLYIA